MRPPSLSGGRAQRLKLTSKIGKTQSDSVFVFDEPRIGLHPLDVRILPGVFQTLIEHGTTVNVIEHDLDVIRNANYIIIWILVAARQAGVWLRRERRRKLRKTQIVLQAIFVIALSHEPIAFDRNHPKGEPQYCQNDPRHPSQLTPD